MDQLPQQTKQTNPLMKTIFFFISVLILGFFLGFITKSITIPQKINPPVAIKPAIDESKLPVSLLLLTNPIVYEWRGSVKGKITKKDEHNFTLVDDQGHNITITDLLATGDKWNTLFFDKTNSKYNNRIPYNTIPIGSFLTGEFFIFKGGPNTPVGSMFIKQ